MAYFFSFLINPLAISFFFCFSKARSIRLLLMLMIYNLRSLELETASVCSLVDQWRHLINIYGQIIQAKQRVAIYNN